MMNAIIEIPDQPNNPGEETPENEPNNSGEGALENEPINPREGAPENEPNNPREGAPKNEPNNPREGAPENELTIKAMVEMALNGMGKLENVWVMAALQGGFVFTVQRKDFVFIIVTLLFRGIRIFCGSPEHNIQQLALFYWFQLVSAVTTGVLSAMQLYSQDFGQTKDEYKANRDFALNVFYVVALAETLLLLAEKAIWNGG